MTSSRSMKHMDARWVCPSVRIRPEGNAAIFLAVVICVALLRIIVCNA